MVKTIFKFIPLTLLFSILTLTSCKENKTPVEKNEITNIATLEYKISSKLGEGAIWNYKTEELYWVDIEGQTLNIYNPKTKNNNVIKTPSKIGTVVPYTKQQAVIALEDGIYQVNLDNGKLNQISDIEASMTENRFNDGKCDPQGNFGLVLCI